MVCIYMCIHTYIKNKYIIVFSVDQSGKLATTELSLLEKKKKCRGQNYQAEWKIFSEDNTNNTSISPQIKGCFARKNYL